MSVPCSHGPLNPNSRTFALSDLRTIEQPPQYPKQSNDFTLCDPVTLTFDLILIGG